MRTKVNVAVKSAAVIRRAAEQGCRLKYARGINDMVEIVGSGTIGCQTHVIGILHRRAENR